jgi:hypothetical protein
MQFIVPHHVMVGAPILIIKIINALGHADQCIMVTIVAVIVPISFDGHLR